MSTIRDEKYRRLDELSVRASRAFVDSGLHGIAAEVVLAIDVSEGMAPLFANGFVQDLTTALLALAMKFDDNGRVPLWTFSQEALPIGEIRQQDHRGWVDRHVPAPRAGEGGAKATRFAPLIDGIGRRHFPAEWDRPPTQKRVGDKLKRTVLEHVGVDEPRPCPVFVIVVTSGDCDDVIETTKLLRRSSWLPVFWQFAGVSPKSEGAGAAFRFLKGIDKLTDTFVDNCGFFMPAIEPLATGAGGREEARSGLVRRARFELNEQNLFNGLLNEFPRYLAHERVAPMLQASPDEEPRSDTGDRLEGLIMALPDKEAARRERERLEREQRRAMRAQLVEHEIERAASWPKIRHEAELEEGEDPAKSPPLPVVRHRGDGPRRVQPDTRPYQPEDGPAPALPPRHPTMSFGAVEPDPVDEASAEDEDLTVETAAERLARIRARRNARRTGPG